ncbi:ribbon-helix-helix domain-containing protein [Azospirillum halopraeferens]|uniref:ribbon-helix-helix domain-containing protein n=1 Tax=Azospirillum halopraeferens TaxID=34010 RepID=UPI0003F934B4|nr:ribbon-helix-helix domain-containing protein [Azospirillum halopraeferens]
MPRPTHSPFPPLDDLFSSLSSAGPLRMRNITVKGQRTTMRLESALWKALEEIGAREGMSISQLCSRVKEQIENRTPVCAEDEKVSLTAAVRLFLLTYYRAAALEHPLFDIPPMMNGRARQGEGYRL